MATEGMMFTQFYTSAAICSPSRASLLTGKVQVHSFIYTIYIQNLQEDCPSGLGFIRTPILAGMPTHPRR